MTISTFLILHATIYFAQAQVQSTAPERKFFDSAGVKIHYVDQGEGEPVILIHGFGANLNVNWGPVLHLLDSEYRVIALDNRGHGRSDKPRQQSAYGIEMVNDIVRLLDHLKIEKAHIVGYSMGALIAGKFLAEHPDRVISATIGGMGYIELNDEWKALMESIATSLESGGGVMPLLKYLNSWHKPPRTEEELRPINTLLMVANDELALAAVIRKMPDFAFPKEVLQKNELPVLSIVGDVDPFKEHVDAMAPYAKGMEFVVIKGGDHVTTIRSAEFVNHIKEFLDKHRQSAPPAKAKVPARKAA